MSRRAGTAAPLLCLAVFFAAAAGFVGCDTLLWDEPLPCTILSVRLSRLAEAERHTLTVTLRPREVRAPTTAEVRFRLVAKPAEEGGEPAEALLRYAGALGEGEDGIRQLETTFNTPFGFLPRDPLTMEEITLLKLSPSGGEGWTGELRYPYRVIEELHTAE